MAETLRDTYEIFERLNISITGLIVVAVILSLSFLFSVREAASWFFKVNDLKKDIRRLRETTVSLEAEIRVLQNLFGQYKDQAPLIVAPGASEESASPEKSATKSSGFPIVH